MMLDKHREAIENGQTDAEWKMVKPPYLGARNSSQPSARPAIVFNGVQYGDELPQELKDAGVEVVNSKQDVMEDEN